MKQLRAFPGGTLFSLPEDADLQNHIYGQLLRPDSFISSREAEELIITPVEG